MKLKCKFGSPQHGWLPVYITKDDFLLDMDVSDVPVNPLDRLIAGLHRLACGLEAQVWWNLEPASYTFKFEPQGTTECQFSITFASGISSTEAQQPIFTMCDSQESIILPFWRAVKEFESHGYSPLAWPLTDKIQLQKLTNLVRRDY